MSLKNNTTEFIPYTTPQEALNQLEQATVQTMGLQLEIIDALSNDLGYSLMERLRLRWQLRVYKRLQKRIYNAIYGLPRIEVPERHGLIAREMRDPQPTDLKGALDELAGLEDGDALIVGPLSNGQKAAAYARAKKRGFVVELKRLFNGDYQLTRIMAHVD